MQVGVPREVKPFETRVSLTPYDVITLTKNKIDVYVQAGAGEKAGFTDGEYLQAGAIICDTAKELYQNATLVVKVKEPQQEEFQYITQRHTLFTFFHFAGVPNLKEAMLNARATCIAYETMRDDSGHYPILSLMSIIAGEESVKEGAKFIHTPIQEAIVTVIGVGNVGMAAVQTAKDMGVAKVILIDNNMEKLRQLSQDGYDTVYATPQSITRAMSISNIVVGAIYRVGQQADKIITRKMLEAMQPDSIFVDVAIDQGGMTEESYAQSLGDPIYFYKNTRMYCVPNMPARAPNKASTQLSQAILPYVEEMATNGVDYALTHRDILKRALATKNGMSYI
jgi:alanine dehydrogenase